MKGATQKAREPAAGEPRPVRPSDIGCQGAQVDARIPGQCQSSANATEILRHARVSFPEGPPQGDLVGISQVPACQAALCGGEAGHREVHPL